MEAIVPKTLWHLATLRVAQWTSALAGGVPWRRTASARPVRRTASGLIEPAQRPESPCFQDHNLW
ncbi:MAG: hypothetical protein AAF721_13615 [Myxococcota bacterium]